MSTVRIKDLSSLDKPYNGKQFIAVDSFDDGTHRITLNSLSGNGISSGYVLNNRIAREPASFDKNSSNQIPSSKTVASKFIQTADRLTVPSAYNDLSTSIVKVPSLCVLSERFIVNERIAKTLDEFDETSITQVPSSKVIAKLTNRNKSNITVYISPDGSDDNTGLTENSPLFSLTKACEKLSEFRSNKNNIGYQIQCLPKAGGGTYKYTEVQRISHPDCVPASECRIKIIGNNNIFDFNEYIKSKTDEMPCIKIYCCANIENLTVDSGITEYDNRYYFNKNKDNKQYATICFTCQYSIINFYNTTIKNFSRGFASSNGAQINIHNRLFMRNIYECFLIHRNGELQFYAKNLTETAPYGNEIILDNVHHVITTGINGRCYFTDFVSKRTGMTISADMLTYFNNMTHNATFQFMRSNPDGVSFEDSVNSISSEIWTHNRNYAGMQNDGIYAKDLLSGSPYIIFQNNDTEQTAVSRVLSAFYPSPVCNLNIEIIPNNAAGYAVKEKQ